VATAKNDHAAYGHYYQWGRNDDGHEDRTKTGTSSTDLKEAGEGSSSSTIATRNTRFGNLIP
jgi:hypothetical protein